MDNIELGKRLKQARISCNYTMEDIAKKIGVANFLLLNLLLAF